MKIKNSVIIMLTLTLVAISTFPVTLKTVHCLPADSMWIEPSTLSFNTTTTPVGSRFNITVYANISVPSYAWQIFIVYNAEHLNYTRFWYSAGSKSEWAGTKPTSPIPPASGDYNGTHKFFCLGESLQGPNEVPAGSYSLAIIEFEIISAPPEREIYESQISLDIIGDFNSYVLDPDLWEIPLNFGNAAYSYGGIIGPPPPPPPPPPPTGTRLFVDPAEIVDPTLFPPATFKVNVTIDDVQNLYGYEFNMSFNKEILTCISLAIHDVQGETNYIPEMQINNPKGFLWVRVTYYPPANPITTTTPLALVTITFRVKAVGTSLLDLHDTKLWDNAGNPISHETYDGSVTMLIRDVAIINVYKPYEWVYHGWIVNITVTAKNLGMSNETFDVTAYFNETAIGTINVANLPPDGQIDLTFTWNTSGAIPCNKYVIWAEAAQVPYEINTTNNIYVDETIKIRLIGDINNDGTVDIKDVAAVSMAFGSRPGMPEWNQAADINQDNKIDVKDVALVSKMFTSKC
jgi:hypothetical protein